MYRDYGHRRLAYAFFCNEHKLKIRANWPTLHVLVLGDHRKCASYWAMVTNLASFIGSFHKSASTDSLHSVSVSFLGWPMPWRQGLVWLSTTSAEATFGPMRNPVCVLGCLYVWVMRSYYHTDSACLVSVRALYCILIVPKPAASFPRYQACASYVRQALSDPSPPAVPARS